MKFLVDSCISLYAVKALREKGFDVVWIPETGADPGDNIIIRKAFDESRVLITADKDFGELVYLFKNPHNAIIRLVDIPAMEQGRIVTSLVDTHGADIETKSIITVEKTRIRIRVDE